MGKSPLVPLCERGITSPFEKGRARGIYPGKQGVGYLIDPENDKIDK